MFLDTVIMRAQCKAVMFNLPATVTHKGPQERGPRQHLSWQFSSKSQRSIFVARKHSGRFMMFEAEPDADYCMFLTEKIRLKTTVSLNKETPK